MKPTEHNVFTAQGGQNMSTEQSDKNIVTGRPTWNDLSASDLRHIAAGLDALDPSLAVRRRLDPERREELADMELAGRKPAVGWWRRALGVPESNPIFDPTYLWGPEVDALVEQVEEVAA